MLILVNNIELPIPITHPKPHSKFDVPNYLYSVPSTRASIMLKAVWRFDDIPMVLAYELQPEAIPGLMLRIAVNTEVAN